ncbi:diguanylate cyclase [Dethiosulfovibrio sp. F2B]|uniref:diguanylate cyclase n=1 Tax=Dethiosulfovibrio faecalis TaxID=2720018 RepID=UPI001F1FC8D9|nr:diguanylate cyclase [Dethiosulfovibrio faecalis]MCF4151712.1 diguanylate cyclase [Dethiosulfovibrio faecalis]
MNREGQDKGSFFTLTREDIKEETLPDLRKNALQIFLSMLVFVTFMSTQTWMDRRAIGRHESTFNMQQSRQVMVGREAMEDRLRSIISRLSALTNTSLPQAIKMDATDFIKERLSLMVHANEDIAAVLLKLKDGTGWEYSYSRLISPGPATLRKAREVMTVGMDGRSRNSSPVRVDTVDIVDRHPIMVITFDIFSGHGKLQGYMVVALDLLPSINRYIVPLRGGPHGWAYLVDENGKILYHQYPSLTGSPASSFLTEDREAIDTMIAHPSGEGSLYENYGSGRNRKLVAWDTLRVLDRKLLLVLSTPEEDVDAIVQEDRTLRFLLGLMLLSSLLLSFLWIADRRHRARLRESEARYQTIIDDQFELVSRFDTDGRYSFVNDAYCSFFGVKREEILGKPLESVRDLRYASVSMELFKSISLDSPSNFNEERISMPDGSTRYLSWSNRGIFDEKGKLVEIQGVARDITDGKEVELALQEETLQLENLHSIVQKLTSAGSKSELIRSLIESLTEEMDYRSAFVSLRSGDDEGSELFSSGDRKRPHVKTEDQAVTTEHPLVLQREDRLTQLSVPVTFKGRKLGVLSVLSVVEPKEREIKKISILSDHLAGLLVLLEVMDKRTREALIDPLTDIWNRRYILKHLESENNRIKRYGEKASLAIIDLGEFKLVNDLYGHEAGDETLKKIASVLKESIRICDMVARYGGDEFLVYLPNTSPKQAEVVLSRASQMVAIRDFPHPVALDYGIAGFPDDGETIEEIIKVADDRMYAAKARRKQKR